MKFEIREEFYGQMLRVFAGDKEVSIAGLVKIANVMSDKLKLEGYEIRLPELEKAE